MVFIAKHWTAKSECHRGKLQGCVYLEGEGRGGGGEGDGLDGRGGGRGGEAHAHCSVCVLLSALPPC